MTAIRNSASVTTGASSDSGGVGYWSLLVGGTVLRSNMPISVGQTSLLVLQMNFSTTGDTFSLYVNPTSLGSSAPTAANAQLTGSNITFSSLVYNAGYTTQVSTIDELRLGQSFAAVTPTTGSSGGGGSKTTPTVTVTDNSGTFTDAPFVATDAVNGVSNLEGVTPSLTYYAGTSATGTPLGSAPTAVGTYTVVASFPGSTDYTSASASRTFTITKATPNVSVADGGGTYTAQSFPATDSVSGVGSQSTPSASLEGVTPTLTYYSGTQRHGHGAREGSNRGRHVYGAGKFRREHRLHERQ